MTTTQNLLAGGSEFSLRRRLGVAPLPTTPRPSSPGGSGCRPRSKTQNFALRRVAQGAAPGQRPGTLPCAGWLRVPAPGRRPRTLPCAGWLRVPPQVRDPELCPAPGGSGCRPQVRDPELCPAPVAQGSAPGQRPRTLPCAGGSGCRPRSKTQNFALRRVARGVLVPEARGRPLPVAPGFPPLPGGLGCPRARGPRSSLAVAPGLPCQMARNSLCRVARNLLFATGSGLPPYR